MSYKKQLLYCTSSYQPLKAAMMATKRFTSGKLARSIDGDGNPSKDDIPFPDGERYHRLLDNVEDRPVVLLGGTISDAETMELYDLANMLVENFAAKLKIVIPYFGCSTQERAILPGEAVKAKYRARLLSSIPKASMGNSVYLMDLHSEGIPHYFENGVIARHIYAKPLVINAAERLAKQMQLDLSKVGDTSDEAMAEAKVRMQKCDGSDAAEFTLEQFAFASTDTGRAKWVESLARDMVARGLPVHPAFIIKRRLGGASTMVLDISADVEGKIVIIYDDMIRTGGSLIKAAEAYLQKGALAVAAIATHGILPGESLKRLEDSGKFVNIVVTDSHPNVLELQNDFMMVESCAGLLTEYLVTGKKAGRSKEES